MKILVMVGALAISVAVGWGYHYVSEWVESAVWRVLCIITMYITLFPLGWLTGEYVRQ
jgi:hypothetical protein